MKKITAIVLLSSVISVSATEKVAYGEDNRVDVVDSANTIMKELSLSTATQIPNKNLTLKDNGSYDLAQTTLAQFMPQLSWGVPLCKGEKFENQLAIGNCSGFLVGDKYLVTAGHCMASLSDCSGSKWVFDYKKGEIEDYNLEASKVYSCKRVIKQQLDGATKSDYALIELDRVVEGRAPLKFRTEGKIALEDGLVVIGSPSGLPLKIAGDSVVKVNTNDVYFEADLDTFGGNSGSAVFNATTGEVEGILVRGAKDYSRVKDEAGNSCMTVNMCEEYGGYGCDGEEVTRISMVGITEAITKNEDPSSAYESPFKAVVVEDYDFEDYNFEDIDFSFDFSLDGQFTL
ncbi:hypothetical protein A9Q84_16555 [Halobacteriovorax marinus]|uniref:Serine protease n=1 Tax=Halobacteriovorax marinus TaxID=97084 RepID=A0A1Y5F4E1_9BACT|nr:hypothetical protein A9Q84_16555 [Halobacteriovorax marinus]